jgi:hypothetical protein
MYTFIAFKPESTETACGCNVGTYSGDFVFFNGLYREQLLEKLIKYFKVNFSLGHQEDGYEFFVFEDGILLYEKGNYEFDTSGVCEYNSTRYHELEACREIRVNNFANLMKEANGAADKQLKKEKQDRLDSIARNEKEKQEKRLNNDKFLYQELKKKFEPKD